MVEKAEKAAWKKLSMVKTHKVKKQSNILRKKKRFIDTGNIFYR